MRVDGPVKLGGYEVEVRQVEWSGLQLLRPAARREKLSFKNSVDPQDTVWFGAYVDGELVGCAAVFWMTKDHTKARCKSYLVLPEWRGLGIGRVLNIERLRWLEEDTVCREVQVYPKRRQVPVWEKLGFEVIENPHPEDGGRLFLARRALERSLP